MRSLALRPSGASRRTFTPASRTAQMRSLTRLSEPIRYDSESAVIVIAAGVRALICMIPVPSRMRSVRQASYPIEATASISQASADPTESTPIRSASTTSSTIVLPLFAVVVGTADGDRCFHAASFPCSGAVPGAGGFSFARGVRSGVTGGPQSECAQRSMWRGLWRRPLHAIRHRHRA